MKKMFKRSVSLCLTLMMLLTIMCTAFSATALSTSIVDTSKTGSLTITKYEMADISKAVSGSTGEQSDIDKLPADATPLAGVEFTLYKIADLDEYFTPAGVELPTVEEAEAYIKANPTTATYNKVTGTDGVAKFTGLPLAIYYVKETDAPAQVTKMSAPFVLSVPMTNAEGNGWLYDIYCYPKNQTAYSDITMKKVDSATNQALPNAKFTLYSSEDNATYTEYMADLTTNASGEVVLSNLPSNKYYRFIETQTSDASYILDKTAYYDFFVDGTGDVIRNGAVVEDKKIVIGNEKPEIHKYVLDGEKGTKGIDNTASYGDTVYWEIDTTIPTVVEKMDTYTIVDTMSTGHKYLSAEIMVDNKIKLTEGTDYEVSQKNLTVTFTINPASLADGEVVNLYLNTELTTEAPLAQDIPNTSKLIYTNDIDTDSTYEIQSETPNVHTGGYSFYKIDTLDGRLEGATFAIYASEEDAKNDTNRIDTQTSNADGLVEFKGLAYGGFSADEDTKAVNGTLNGSTDYWIVEIDAPEGYILFQDTFKVTVNANSHDPNHTDEIINTPKFETPQTGGTASMVPILGSVLLMVGLVLFVAARKKTAK